ncbi:MAG TPA: hypothetical protein VFL63_07980, partial [Rhodanobacteraceae bacterium]|nr:hypothetical protein [Rhodanobacteraceae bacterium]
RDLAYPGRHIDADDVFMMEAEESGELTNATVTQLGDGVRINVQPTRRSGPRTFHLEYRVLYGVVDDDGNSLYWPLTVASNRLPAQHASLRVTLPEETPSDKILAEFQLDGADPGDLAGGNPIKGYRVSLAWPRPQAVAPGQTLAALITYPEVSDSSLAINVPRGPAWMFNGWIWLAVLAIYYLMAKIFFTGGGERKPTIVEYEPPKGWSAGAMRLLRHGSWDRKCFATGVLAIAAKGGLTLDKQADGGWIATRAGADLIPALTADENSLRSALFAFGQTAPFSSINSDSIGVAELAYQRTLEARCARERPVDPAWLLFPGWLIALPGALLLLFATSGRLAIAAELFVPALIAALALGIVFKMVPGWILRATRAQAVLAAMICAAALLASPSLAHWLTGVALLAGQVAAGWWLPRQPPKDTPLLRQIRGFRWYLGTAEQQDMDARYKPSLHPELQASLLPYAMALDVEVAWNARFAGAVAKTGRQAEFAASLNPDHDRAALELLAFAEAMSRQTRTQAAAPDTDTLTSGT